MNLWKDPWILWNEDFKPKARTNDTSNPMLVSKLTLPNNKGWDKWWLESIYIYIYIYILFWVIQLLFIETNTNYKGRPKIN